MVDIQTILSQTSRSPNKQNNPEQLPAIMRQLSGLNRKGTSKLFTPEQLLTVVNEYATYVANNPIQSNQLITGGAKGGSVIPVDKPRMMLISDLCSRIGIYSGYLKELGYQIEGKDDEISRQYSTVLQYMKDLMFAWNVQRAGSGDINALIVARIEQLAEKTESKVDVTNTVTSITFVRQAIEDTDYTEVQEALDTE